MRVEFESRLGAAERKVYALTKERDALRRGADKLNSVNDLVKEKDAIIQQVPSQAVKDYISWGALLILRCPGRLRCGSVAPVGGPVHENLV